MIKKRVRRVTQVKTNFDVCCESIETMAQIIDIMKCGWSKDQIMKWLKSPFTERGEKSDEGSIKIPRGKE